MLEKDIERHFTAATKKRDGVSIKLTDEQMAGLPDRLVLLPNGRAAFVEFKAPGKKPRPLQLHRIEGLRGLGFNVFVVDSKDQAEGVLDEIQAT